MKLRVVNGIYNTFKNVETTEEHYWCKSDLLHFLQPLFRTLKDGARFFLRKSLNLDDSFGYHVDLDLLFFIPQRD